MKKFLILIVTVIGFAAGIYTMRGAIDKHYEFTQPIDFSHYVHASKYKIPCIACHQHVLFGARAGIPNIEICGACHSTPMKKTPGEEQVFGYVKSHKQIPWYSIYYVPDYVYFSHLRHVVIGKLDCKLCHGDMAAFTSPPITQFLKIRMSNCIDCHQKRHASTDCWQCHR
ncbi:MAG: cytochrome c family protein [Bacteroidetes bacterium]|nr:cytochrome c family protein [Bacteroidota bacterium]MCL5738789.1 cytochrome c family protein [Bacteroidota bacterium]